MRQNLNQLTAIIELALQRTWAAKGSYAAILLGVLVATTTITALILYAEAVNDAVLRDELSEAHRNATFDLLVKGTAITIDANAYNRMNSLITRGLNQRVGIPVTHIGRHGWSQPFQFVPPETSPVGQRNELPRVRFQFYADIEQYVDVIQGELARPVSDPQARVEAMVGQGLADQLGLSVGDVFRVERFTGSDQPMQVEAQLTAIIQARENLDQPPLYAARFLDEAITVPETSFFEVAALNLVPNGSEVTWSVNYDETAINLTTVDRTIFGLDLVNFDLTSQLDDLQFLTQLDNTLRGYKRDTFLLRALLIVLGAPVLGIAIYYITMSSQLLVDNQQGEIALLKSRGSSTSQVLIVLLVQGLLIVLAAAILAPLLALPTARLIGRASTFMVFDNSRVLPVILRPHLYGYATAAALLTLLALMLPAHQSSRQTIVTQRRSAARDSHRSFFHRFYLDLLLILAGGLGLRSLGESGSIISRSDSGGLAFDPMLLITPIVLVAGLTFLSLRFIPLFLHGLAHLLALTDAVAPLMALRQIARTPARYQGLILLLTFTLALGLFTATVAAAFDRNDSDQAFYAVGTDLRTREFDRENAIWTTRPLAEYQALPGVETASPAIRVRLVGRRTQVIARGNLLAIEPESFAQTAWWREDFEPSLTTLLAQLNQDERAILADPNFIRRNRLSVGDIFSMDVDGTPIDFVLAGNVGLFPTLFPDDGDRLVAQFDYVADQLSTEPSEIWLHTRPRQHGQTIAALNDSSDKLVVIENGHQLAGRRESDPLRTGLFGALSLGFVTATGLSILGFLLYAYFSIQSRSLQFGVLRATGYSVQQLITTLAAEQLLLIGIGICLGTILGGAAGWLFTRYLQVSIIAREAVPPFLVSTPWNTIGQLYLILIVIFAAALLVSVTLLRRLKIHAILRLGEQ